METFAQSERELSSPSGTTSAFVPRFPRGLLRNLALDIALPWIVVQLLTRQWAFSAVSAIAIAALFPAASVLGNILRRRRADFIGALVLTTLLGGVILTVVTHDVRFAVLRAVPGATLFAIACLATLGARRPLMFFVARQVSAGDEPQRIAAWNERLAISGFRRAMRLLTLVWGLAFLAKAGIWTGCALLLPLGSAMLVGPLVGIASFAALMAWTIAFARRGAARIAASGGQA